MNDTSANIRQSSLPESQSAVGCRAFTLTELVVVLGAIALLAATVLPALAGTKFREQLAMCMANCRQWGVAMISYSNDHNGYFPNEPLSGAAGGDIWDLPTRFIPDIAQYNLDDPKLWFCPVRSWTYATANAWCQLNSNHPLATATNDVAHLFAYNGVWPNPAFEQIASGGSAATGYTSMGYMPWIKRLWNGTFTPSIYSGGPGMVLNPNRNSPYEWLQKNSDPHAAQVPILTDLVIGNYNTRTIIILFGLRDIAPGNGHPAGSSINGSIQNTDLVYGDGHVETHQASQMQWRFIASVPYNSWY